MECTLEPKTRHGKNRLTKIKTVDPLWGGRWQVISTADQVNFAKGKRGPWHLVEPLFESRRRQSFARWVHATDDDNFTLRSNA